MAQGELRYSDSGSLKNSQLPRHLKDKIPLFLSGMPRILKKSLQLGDIPGMQMHSENRQAVPPPTPSLFIKANERRTDLAQWADNSLALSPVWC